MSPEQAAGDQTLDARTDLYSLASVLYEMLAGEPPFTGPTAQAVVVQAAHRAGAERAGGAADGPASVDEAIRKALALVPADRFATAAQFAQALLVRRTDAADTADAAPTAAAAPAPARPPRPRPPPPFRRGDRAHRGLLIGGGVLFAWRHRRWRRQPDAGGTRIVAVLPFDNLGDSAMPTSPTAWPTRSAPSSARSRASR